MKYRFKPWEELFWSVLVAVATVALLELAGLNPDAVPDWKAWAVALSAGMVRAGAGAAIDYLRRSMTPPGPPSNLADEILSLTDTERELLQMEVDDRLKHGEGGR